ncbi:transcriptional regulator [Limosilactobacillus reuteri subsp. suis]|uniref:transcriptional regulator n=1 Tax=Limosilactobacillus reuteri TaxID=1598 RepID=UPI0039934D1C
MSIRRKKVVNMAEEKLYTINEIINDAGIARSTFDKFAEANNLRPRKTEKRGKKFYSLKDKEFVVKHYISGKGKEEKEKFTNHKAEKHDEIVELLREQVQQLKQANEQLVHDNDILTDQLKAKDEQISAAHQLADQAQKLHLGLEQQVKVLTGDADKPIVDGETSESNTSTSTPKPSEEPTEPKKTTVKSWWHFW